jgi:hypothetical protein
LSKWQYKVDHLDGRSCASHVSRPVASRTVRTALVAHAFTMMASPTRALHSPTARAITRHAVMGSQDMSPSLVPSSSRKYHSTRAGTTCTQLTMLCYIQTDCPPSPHHRPFTVSTPGAPAPSPLGSHSSTESCPQQAFLGAI